MHIGHRPNWLLVGLLFGATFAGCSKTGKPSPPKAVDPAASFDRVVQNVRHYVSQLQTEPYAAIEDGAYTDMSHTREVTDHRLQPPAEEDDDFRGEITVTTRWIISYRPPTENGDEKSGDKQSDPKQDPLKEFANGQGVEVLDKEVIANLPHTSPRDLNDLVPKAQTMSEADEEVQTFHFVFRNDRWELVPEPKEEEATSVEEAPTGLDGLYGQDDKPAVEHAVELALKRQ